MSALARALFALTLTACATGSTGDAPERSTEVALRPPPSARVALENVLSVLAVEREAGRSIDVRSIDATETREKIRVRLDLVIRAANEVVASQHYGELRAALAATTWCEDLNRPNTFPLDEAAGLSIRGLQVSVNLSDEDAFVPEPFEAGFDFDPIIRRIASKDHGGSLGPVTISPSEKRPSASVIDSRYKIEPHEKTGHSLDAILAFASSLEAENQGVVVTGIRLDPSRRTRPSEAIQAWDYEVVMTVRNRAG